MTQLHFGKKLLLGIALGALALTGCGGSSEEEETARSEQTTEAEVQSDSDSEATSSPDAEPEGENVDLPTEPEPVPDPDDVDRMDPDAVAVAMLTTFVLIDTKTDKSLYDGARRSVTYLSDTLAEDINALEDTDEPDEVWDEMVAHEAFMVLDEVTNITEPGGEPDTDLRIVRTYRIAGTPVGRDGWVGAKNEDEPTLALTRENVDAPWVIDEFA